MKLSMVVSVFFLFLITLIIPAFAVEFKFDFQPSGSPVATGFIEINKDDLYSSPGYGWSTAVDNDGDRAIGSNLERDFVYDNDDRMFNVDLPNGEYTVTVYLGDKGAFAHDDVFIDAEGGPWDLSDVDTAVGEVKDLSFNIAVSDGQLNILFRDTGGADPNWVSEGITIVPRDLTVCSSGCDFDKIQDAIDAAAPGATINVGSGTYVEDLTIPETKTDLNLLGFSATIKGIQNVPIGSWPLAVPNIEILANGVRIRGFTVEGPDYEAGKYSSGMVIGAKDVKIYSNDFKVTPAATTDEISQAIQTYHKDAKPGVDISGLVIRDNTFTHLSSGVAGYEGIYLNLDEGSGDVKIEDNQFIGNVVRAITTERSKTIINENTISTDLAPGLPGGYQGINVGGANSGAISTVSITENTINGSSSGKGFKYGIKIGYQSASTFNDVTISKNTIQMNEIGIWTKITANGIVVNFNNLYENDMGVKNDDSVNVLDAQLNWWGSGSGPLDTSGTIEVPPCTNTPTTEKNADGTGDGVSDNVDYCPWLTGQINPSDKTKPEVISFTTSDPSPIKAGTIDFIVVFNKEMNIFVAPKATLHGSKIPIPSRSDLLNGWLDTNIWIGQLVITNTFPGDGEYDFTISNAEDVVGNRMGIFRERDLIIDTTPPEILGAFAPDIFGTQDLTVSASAFDPGSTGISKITVAIDGGAEQDMTFSFREEQRIGGKKVDVDTYFLTILGSSLGDGGHNAVFKAIDAAGNEIVSSPVSFDKDPTIKTTGGSIAYLCKDDPVSEIVRRFDFGTKRSPVQVGYTKATDETAYPTGFGYGWSALVFGSVDRGIGDRLVRDFVFDSVSREFKVNLPSDTYDVTVFMGDMLFAHDDMSVNIEGTLVSDIDSNVGQIQVITREVSVTDGQLNIEFSDAGGSDSNWVLNAIEISSKPRCLDGIEKQTIEWLKSKGWTVDFDKYSDWDLSALIAHDLIVCSDQDKACKPTSAVSSAHKYNNMPFVEIADSASARAAASFDYLSTAGGSRSRSTTNIFIKNSDSITTGFFGITQILDLPQRLTKIVRSLPPIVKDIASPDESPKGTNLFKVGASGSQGRFVYAGWFDGRRGGWTAEDLNANGQLLLEKALNWAQCSNPIGCIA